MKSIVLAAGVAAVALMGGSAMAAPKAKMGATVASPSQPIPYAQLDAYLKASPKQRATRDWWSGAATGAPADTSASASTGATMDSSTAATPAPPVNPAPDAGAMPSATPSTDSAAAPSPNPTAATPAPDASAAPMTEPKPQ
jgi:hypothetical protein